MAMVKDKLVNKNNKKISRQQLRKRLILETIKENREALERLSRT